MPRLANGGWLLDEGPEPQYDAPWGRRALEVDRWVKHSGPGPHPSGSSQEVHGGGAPSPNSPNGQDGPKDWKAEQATLKKLAEAVIVDEKVHHHGGGISESFKIPLGDGRAAIVKPLAGMQGPDHVELEVAAYSLAEAIGWSGLVPVTVSATMNIKYSKPSPEREARRAIRPGADKKASIQMFEKGTRGGDMDMKIISRDSPDFPKAAIFDLLIANQDRHGGNFLYQRDTKRVILIDHNLAWGERTVRYSYFHVQNNVPGQVFYDLASQIVPKQKLALETLRKVGLSEEKVEYVAGRFGEIKDALTLGPDRFGEWVIRGKRSRNE